MLAKTPDDAKTFGHLIECLDNLLVNGGCKKMAHDAVKFKGESEMYAAQNPLMRNKSWPRMVHISRAQIQYKLRTLEQEKYALGRPHLKGLDNLLTLATSHYSSVRIPAQDLLAICLGSFSHREVSNKKDERRVWQNFGK